MPEFNYMKILFTVSLKQSYGSTGPVFDTYYIAQFDINLHTQLWHTPCLHF